MDGNIAHFALFGHCTFYLEFMQIMKTIKSYEQHVRLGIFNCVSFVFFLFSFMLSLSIVLTVFPCIISVLVAFGSFRY